MTTRPIGPLRLSLAWALLAVYLILPFLRVGGQSALRLDIPTLKLYFFGSVIWVDELFIVLAALLFLAFLLIWTTLVFGRIWCGWLCPQSVLIEISTVIAGKRRSRPIFITASLAISILVGTATIWYFVPPLDFLSRLADLKLSPLEAWSTLSLIVIFWLDMSFLGRTFCSTVCPYAMLQRVMYDSNTMALGFEADRRDECMGCDACVRACPVGIDLREGPKAACFVCEGCRDACARMLAPKDRPALIRHFFGAPEGRMRIGRPASVMLASFTAVMLGMFITVIYLRSPLDVTVLPDNEFVSRSIIGGGAVSSFLLAMSNRGRERIEVLLSSEGARLSPDVVGLGPGEYQRIMVMVLIDNAAGVDGIDLMVSEVGDKKTIERRVPLRLPGGRQ
jgi:cytochrome c oxidase accessory protein FixG